MPCITLSAVWFQKGCFLLKKTNSIGIIGTGKAASALLRHFSNHQIIISGVWGRNEEKANELGRFFEISPFKTKTQLIQNSDIIILAVNDGSIKSVAFEISEEIEASPFVLQEKIFVHLSGALPASELTPLDKYGAKILSAHIIQALSASNYLSKKDILENVWFSLQGDVFAVSVFEKLLAQCKNQSFVISEEAKPLYHSAMCVFSNYLVTLIASGFNLLEPIGLDFHSAFNVVLPLLTGTLENIKDAGAAAALTGPIARGDSLTVEKHLAAIQNAHPDSLALYTLMGMETLKLVKDENRNTAIKDLLTKEIDEIFIKKVK